MKLVDLDPRWLVFEGARLGFVFRSPKNPAYYQSVWLDTPARRFQWECFRAAFQTDEHAPNVQGAREGTHWSIEGGIDDATWETMTVTPSVDGSPAGLWHGFIRNGEIVGDL